MPPQRYKSAELSRDEQLRIKVLCEAGLMHSEVAQRTGATIKQVQYADQHPVTPCRRSGRAPTLSQS
jgi:hypothetical protein